MDFHALGFWDSLGHAKIGDGIVVLLVSVAWEAQLKYLEFDSRMHNVDCLVGAESLLLWEYGEDLGWVEGFKPT